MGANSFCKYRSSLIWVQTVCGPHWSKPFSRRLNVKLTTALPTATPAAVDAIFANNPGCLGCCAMGAGCCGGGWAGTEGRGAGRLKYM